MPSQPRKLRFPRWANAKAKGELAEAIFVVKAQALGLAISKPYGDNKGFDFHIESRLGTFRVQVKSAWKVMAAQRYWLLGGRRSPGKRRAYDVLVAYVAPLDVWYVIPEWDIRSSNIWLYPTVANSRGKFERYREGWRTLTGDVHDDTRRIGLDIHAQAEPGKRE